MAWVADFGASYCDCEQQNFAAWEYAHPSDRDHLDYNPAFFEIVVEDARNRSRWIVFFEGSYCSRGRESSMNPQRIQSIVSDSSHPQPQSQRMQGYNRGGHDPMDGHTPMRQNFAAHNHNMMHQNRPPRPFVDTRPSYSGSPPFMTPNSSYHGSPQSGSPHYGNRGGWGGQQPYQSHHGYGNFLTG